jgi:hypothetical protein
MARSRRLILRPAPGRGGFENLKDISGPHLRQRQPLRGADKIDLTVGALLGRRKVAKHFRILVGSFVGLATVLSTLTSAADFDSRLHRSSGRLSLCASLILRHQSG